MAYNAGQTVEHRTHFTRLEQHETLQSHVLVLVSMNGLSGFLFCVEPTRSKTLVSARTIEALGINVDDSSSRVTISEKLVYPVVRLESIGIATATVNALDVVVWGRPLIQAEIRVNEKDRLYQLGNGMPGDSPPSAITTVIECHGVLGADFLRNFKLSLDFRTDTMVLEE